MQISYLPYGERIYLRCEHLFLYKALLDKMRKCQQSLDQQLAYQHLQLLILCFRQRLL